MPDWATRWFVIAGVIGFPFWVAFAWFYEWTPEGFKREHEVEDHESITHHTGRKLDFAIIGVLSLAVVLLLTDRFVLRRGVNQEADIAISKQSIAVLPFVDMSQGKDQEYFSDWYLRGAAESPGESPGAACGRANVLVLVQGKGRTDP
jgi:hypothetical protein